MKKIKVLALILVLALAIGCFAACSKDNTETTTGTGSETTTAAEAAAVVKVIDISLTDELYAFGVAKDDAELLASCNTYIAKIKADGTFEEIVNKYFGDGTPTPVASATEDSSKDQLIVATNAEFAPFEYIEGDKYLGVDMELAAGLAAYLNKELVIKNIDFDSVLTTVDAGYADLAMSGLTINEKRTEFVNFTDSYYTASQYLLVPAADTTFDACTTAADIEAILNGFAASTVIGVQNGTTGQYYVEGDADWGFAGYKATCKGYSSGALAATDMLNGNVNYIIIDQAPAAYIAESMNGTAK